MATIPQIGDPVEVSPGIRSVLAPNASPMTYWGTNTYLIGTGPGLAIVDPGPNDEAHLAAILSGVGSARIDAILVTHAHRDHSPLATRLGRELGVPVLAFGDAFAGRSKMMQQLADQGLVAGGEGVDEGFVPDRSLPDGATLETEAGPLTAIWTPGHFGNHMSFVLGGTVFTGDVVMGWASSLVSPPDGDLAQFRRALDVLEALQASRFLPGHGDPIEDPAARITWLRAHRAEREAQLIAALQTASGTPAELTRQVYKDVDPALWPAAERNLLAHLVDLVERGLVAADPALSVHARFALH